MNFQKINMRYHQSFMQLHPNWKERMIQEISDDFGVISIETYEEHKKFIREISRAYKAHPYAEAEF